MTAATMTKAEPSKAARPASTKISVQFVYAPGLKRAVFRNVRLTGSWDREGRYSDDWSTIPMEEYTGEDGCPCYRAAVGFDESQAGWTFHWGVIVDGPAGKGQVGYHHRGPRRRLVRPVARVRAPAARRRCRPAGALLPDP